MQHVAWLHDLDDGAGRPLVVRNGEDRLVEMGVERVAERNNAPNTMPLEGLEQGAFGGGNPGEPLPERFAVCVFRRRAFDRTPEIVCGRQQVAYQIGGAKSDPFPGLAFGPPPDVPLLREPAPQLILPRPQPLLV